MGAPADGQAAFLHAQLTCHDSTGSDGGPAYTAWYYLCEIPVEQEHLWIGPDTVSTNRESGSTARSAPALIYRDAVPLSGCLCDVGVLPHGLSPHGKRWASEPRFRPPSADQGAAT